MLVRVRGGALFRSAGLDVGEVEVGEAAAVALGKSWAELGEGEGLSLDQVGEVWAMLKPTHQRAGSSSLVSSFWRTGKEGKGGTGRFDE